uniref:Secreted protein n=1 Tax=Macrostomum lignano TaxID=282301 RepID=A0A1I8F512_9PLAT
MLRLLSLFAVALALLAAQASVSASPVGKRFLFWPCLGWARRLPAGGGGRDGAAQGWRWASTERLLPQQLVPGSEARSWS